MKKAGLSIELIIAGLIMALILAVYLPQTKRVKRYATVEGERISVKDFNGNEVEAYEKDGKLYTVSGMLVGEVVK